jgi:exopolysaccharide biosynthesis protein
LDGHDRRHHDQFDHRPASAELGNQDWAAKTARQLADGYTPQLTDVRWPDYSDTPHGLEGVRVRTSDYPTQAAAQAAVTTLQGLGFPTATAEWTGYDADQQPDAQQIHEAIIDPRLARIEVPHNGVVAQRQTTSSVAAALNALVATNAGFFITSDSFGFQGVPDGAAVYDGKLESLNNGPRAALIIDHGRLSFNYAWAETRQPRTIAGIDRQGRLILVTVDGRQPGVSEGATLSEEATLMESLGAVDAMNLDGGGSTAMAVDGKLVNHTSDATGERPDGDFVVVLPPRS